MSYKNNYFFNNFKNKQKDTDIEKSLINENKKCLCCNDDTNNGYLFCLECYNYIKITRQSFDHNRSERNIQNHYFELRDSIKNIKKTETFNEKIQMMFALSEELQYIYDNEYLAERVNKDIITLHTQFTKKLENLKEKKIVEEFDDRDIRDQWPREILCKDGHYVRSRAEKIIDDWLYDNGYVHAYEKLVFMPTAPNDNILCDFFLPKGKIFKEEIYIEFWGLEDNENYNKRKNYKIKLYNENNLNRIDLNEKEINRIEDIMPRLLAKYTQ